jgi:Domain of unkown function (DUF1775)
MADLPKRPQQMTLIKRAVPGALILAALIATALYVGAAPAWAHVEVEANNTARGGEAILTVEVPNESDTGALTTQFSVALPNVTSASAELMSGWTALSYLGYLWDDAAWTPESLSPNPSRSCAECHPVGTVAWVKS